MQKDDRDKGPTSMRSILEEGLKKGSSSQPSYQNRYVNDRYNDIRKERKIKEAKKIVDLKKIEGNTASSAPNLDSILTSMDKITKKPEKKNEENDKDKNDISADKIREEQLRKQKEADDLRAKQLKEERDQERQRRQRERQEQEKKIQLSVLEDDIADDLVEDNWGQPMQTAVSKLQTMMKPNIRSSTHVKET